MVNDFIGKEEEGGDREQQEGRADQDEREEYTAKSQRVALQSNHFVSFRIISYHSSQRYHFVSISCAPEKVYLNQDTAGGEPSQKPSSTSILYQLKLSHSSAALRPSFPSSVPPRSHFTSRDLSLSLRIDFLTAHPACFL
jgi:hypothetical protein